MHPKYHVLSATQFNVDWIMSLFKRAKDFQNNTHVPNYAREFTRSKNKILATLFHEESTRTRLSFEAAMCRLGGQYISVENAKVSSSHVKGESIEDTIRTVSQYADAIVIRHPEIGAVERGATTAEVPVINAGDGAGEHPTQALIDLYTIWLRRHSFKGLNAVVLGSGRARTIHSLLILMDKLEIKVKHVNGFSPQQMGEICDCDVLYMTRIQLERFKEDEQKPTLITLGRYILDCMKPDAMILHPLPRREELPIEVDSDPRAAYWQQVRNGLFVRMALLESIFSGEYALQHKD